MNFAQYTKKLIFGPKINKNGKYRQNENFSKNGVWGSLYPLMPSKFMQNIKKIKFSAIYKKVYFVQYCSTHICSILPFLGETGNFPEKWQHHLKCLMVFCIYAKKIFVKSSILIGRELLPINLENENFPRYDVCAES